MKQLALAAWLCGALTTGAAEKWRVTAELEVLQVPESIALTMIPRLNHPESARAALGELHRLEGGPVKKRAHLHGGAPGARRAQLSQTEVHTHPVFPLPADHRMGPCATMAEDPVVTGYPARETAEFSTGTFLEFRPELVEGEQILLQHSCRVSELREWLRYETGLTARGVKLQVEQPLLEERSTSGTVLLRNGVPCLVGTYRRWAPDGDFELHILTASTRTEAPELAPVQNAPAPAGKRTRPKWSACVELQRFRVPQAEAIQLRERLVDAAQAGPAFAELFELAAAGRATLLDWHVQPSVSSEALPGKTKNVSESAYPTDARDTGKRRFSFSEKASDSPEGEEDNQAQPFPVQPPYSFEVENHGSTLEVWPEVGGSPFQARDIEGPPISPDGRYIRLGYQVRHSEFARFQRWPVGPDLHGTSAVIYRPEFNHRRVSGRVILRNGTPRLIGFHKVPGETSEVDLTLLHATLAPIPQPKPNPARP